MVRALQRFLSLLLALVFTIATGLPTASLVQVTRSAALSKPACKCCAADPATCSTPSCCTRPARGNAPAAPAVPRCPSGNEWLAIAPALLNVLPLTGLATQALSVRQPSVEPRAVPIFLRNCSFLI